MARFTNVVALVNGEWTAVSANEATVIIQCVNSAGCEVALAASSGDLAGLANGHRLVSSGDGLALTLTNLETRVFVRRPPGLTDPITLIVSAY